MTELLKVLGVVALVIALAVGFFWLIVLLSGGHLFVETAGGAFNKHIQALVDEDWELAHSYLHGNCGVTANDLEDTFSQAGSIDPNRWKEFLIFKAGDNEAFVYFWATEGLQYMTRHDGQWLVNCGAPDASR